MKNIRVITTFSKDNIYYEEENKQVLKEGGPGKWITYAFDKLGQKYELNTPNKKALVKIVVTKTGEKGQVVELPKIKIKNEILEEYVLVSTMGDEFEIIDLINIKGSIVLDVQGYVRTKKIHLSKGLAEKILILKATEKELSRLPKTLVADQKKRILIVTKGEKGFVVYEKGKRYVFNNTVKIEPKDTIGAGDVFLSSFLSVYIRRGKNVVLAASFSEKFTLNFLKNK